jgi:acid phosphatase type 7
MRTHAPHPALIGVLVLMGILLAIVASPEFLPTVAAGTGPPNTPPQISTSTPSGYIIDLPLVMDNRAGGLPPTHTPTRSPTPPTATTPPVTRTATPTTTPPPTADPVLVGAGDISSCYVGNQGDEATARLLDVITGAVFTAGDNAYPDGTLDQFNTCYDPTWGRHKARTHPAPGNHEYHTSNAAGYFSYFGAAAGDPSQGYYSYDLGAWHIIVINSNCGFIGGCQAGSAQEQWLRADLAAHPANCTLAYWHHPRFSSGFHGNNTEMRPIWQALYEAGADVVISAHSHGYERFAAQDPQGVADPLNGLREFVVGTGGDKFEQMGAIQPNSEVRNYATHGVLKLTLHPTGYDWQFIPIAGQTFTDSGADVCH